MTTDLRTGVAAPGYAAAFERTVISPHPDNPTLAGNPARSAALRRLD
jgi:hypothetical protein